MINVLKKYTPLLIYILVSQIFTFSMYYMDMKHGHSSLSYIIVTNVLLLFLLLGWLIVKDNAFNKRIKNVYINEFLNRDELRNLEVSEAIVEIMNNMYDDIQSFKVKYQFNTDEERDYISKWMHDIKVPLAAIRLIIENEESIIDHIYPDLDKEIKGIEDCIKKMFYIMKANRFSDDFTIKEVNVKSLIHNSLKEYSTLFSYKSLRLNTDIDDISIFTDSKWCGYIVSELISNAVKYTPDAELIEVSASTSDDNMVIISISNSGSSILEEELPRIFKKGFTGSNGRQGLKSTGYGLYLAKKISILLNHDLRVVSTKERTEFRIIIRKQDELFNLTKM